MAIHSLEESVATDSTPRATWQTGLTMSVPLRYSAGAFPGAFCRPVLRDQSGKINEARSIRQDQSGKIKGKLS
jgi:hypothetical protein